MSIGQRHCQRIEHRVTDLEGNIKLNRVTKLRKRSTEINVWQRVLPGHSGFLSGLTLGLRSCKVIISFLFTGT